MDEVELLNKHNEILEYLLEYKKKDNSFTFSPRKNHNNHSDDISKCRLCNGYWFQGTNNYIFVALYNRGCKDNKTKTIGFVFTEKQYIEIVFKKVDGITQNEKNIYEELVKYLEESNVIKNVEKRGNNDQYFAYFKSSNMMDNLNYFINEFRLKSNELIKQNNLSDNFFVSSDEFNKRIDEINKIRNTKSNNQQKSINLQMEINMSNNLKQIQPLNQILYGSPGTGKTYHTINKALEIIFQNKLTKEDYENGKVKEEKLVELSQNELTEDLNEKTENNTRKILKACFEKYKNAGQIEFVTFHQSYGYEEFVEGIKAIPTGREGNDGEEMIYDVVDGIFKNLSKIAEENFIVENTQTINHKKRFILNAKSLNIQAELIEDDENNYRLLKGSKIRKGEADSFKKYNYSHLKNIFIEKASFDKNKETDEYFILNEDYTFQSLSAASSVILGRMSNGLIDWKEVENQENQVINIDNQKIKNYILIIDEINRGNISKIFGELITLIEDSKRLGKSEQVEITLPYSGEKFGVPQNLYIIGTMNTADRSIAPIDTALRRRFVFEEMAPNPSLLRKEKTLNIYDEVDLKKLLEAINARIEYLYDRDHTIGHAYLIDVKTLDDLKFAFKNKIIPLLAEYFYEDWENIDLVLNKNGMIEEENSNNDYLKNINKINGKKIYKVSDNNWEVKNFRKIYDDNALSNLDEQSESSNN